jgi:RNA-binding protein
MSISLTPKQRQYLKGLAHGLSPVVQMGAAGVTEAVVAAVGEALGRHELIKVKLPKLDDAATREEMAAAVTAASGAAQVQLIGRVLVLYQPRGEDLPDKPRLKLPG